MLHCRGKMYYIAKDMIRVILPLYRGIIYVCPTKSMAVLTMLLDIPTCQYLNVGKPSCHSIWVIVLIAHYIRLAYIDRVNHIHAIATGFCCNCPKTEASNILDIWEIFQLLL